jgi:hypothetical protein
VYDHAAGQPTAGGAAAVPLTIEVPMLRMWAAVKAR